MKEFLHHLSKYSLFLASRSPRRQQLLQDLNIPFKPWYLDEVDEDYPPGLSVFEIAEYLACKKAKPFEKLLQEEMIVITADTIVCYDNEVLGKPKNTTEARSMLETLSGVDHMVITGVGLTSLNYSTVFSVKTDVTFAELTKDEIDHYIDEFKPFDKAGSYGIQEWIGMVGVESIRGSYFNVMGLPVQRLYQELKKFTNYTKTL